MRRYFNTEGVCKPTLHYMVRLDDRLRQIQEHFIDIGKYFVMNRGRQYGKTTTLMALATVLKNDYTVFFLDFQKLSTSAFESEHKFAVSFTEYFVSEISNILDLTGSPELQTLVAASKNEKFDMNEMFACLSKFCGLCIAKSRPAVLLIDEVDSASNYQIFLDFLAGLRGYYLERESKPTFQSVILAGVYDIKNLKLKLRTETSHKYNSPWNIAANFNIEMSFSAEEIAAMLQEYENDHNTKMDIGVVSTCIYEYTSGYPYLVSAICKLLDEEIYGSSGFEKIATVWTINGVMEAVKTILSQQMPLFQSMMRQLDEHPELKQMLNALLFQGKRLTFNPDHPVIGLAAMFGYITNKNGSIQVANRIFESRLYNYFLSEEELTNAMYDVAQGNKSQYFSNGKLNMNVVLEKFVVHFSDIYGDNDEKFIEAYGRKFFLLYLKPIINGTGNYYVEAQTRDARRTDVIVDYSGEQFIIELKIWHGNEYNERGEGQLADYLNYYHQKKGYMLSFNFNKKKERGVKEIHVGDKIIVEAVV